MFTKIWSALQDDHRARMESINAKDILNSDATFETAFLCKTLRHLVPNNTVFAVEAVTNSLPVSE